MAKVENPLILNRMLANVEPEAKERYRKIYTFELPEWTAPIGEQMQAKILQFPQLKE